MAIMTRRSVLAGTGAIGAVWAFGVPRLSAADRQALPIPPEIRADAKGEIAISAQAGTMRFKPGMTTPTYGFNGPFLGPAVRVKRGDRPVMKVTNHLPEETTMHWHGLIIPGAADGGPYRIIDPGATWSVELPVDQPAATLWFHPHIYPVTAELVIKGLAGLFVIDDEESDALPLPKTWGVDWPAP